MKKGGMDRSSWIAAGACMLLLVLYPKIVAHFYPPNPAAAKKAAAQSKNTNAPTAQTPPAASPSLVAKETLAPGSVQRSGEEHTAVLENATLRATFTTWGGGVRSLELLGHAGDPGEKISLNKGSPDAIFELRGWTPAGEGLSWSIEKADAQEVVFLAKAQTGGEVWIRRTFRLVGDYRLSLSQEVENRGTVPLALPAYALAAGVGAPVHLKKDEENYLGAGWFTTDVTYTTHKLPEFLPSNFLFLFPRPGKEMVQSRSDREVRWVAAKSQFFALVLTVQDAPAMGAEARKVDLLGETMRDGSGKVPAVEAWMKLAGFDLGVGAKNRTQGGLASAQFGAGRGSGDGIRLDGNRQPSVARGHEYYLQVGRKLRLVDCHLDDFTQGHSLGSASQGQPKHEKNAASGPEVEGVAGEIQRGSRQAEHRNDAFVPGIRGQSPRRLSADAHSDAGFSRLLLHAAQLGGVARPGFPLDSRSLTSGHDRFSSRTGPSHQPDAADHDGGHGLEHASHPATPGGG
ncbi:hypothetical protein EBX31_10295 [bacterium]|nr:hypothetical protein [bacterium]